MSRGDGNFIFFFFNDTATTEIYTLSLHDALPISLRRTRPSCHQTIEAKAHLENDPATPKPRLSDRRDRKSTRLNSSHSQISYAVFCLKKKKTTLFIRTTPIALSHVHIPDTTLITL